MNRTVSIIVVSSLILAAGGLAGCKKKAADDTNVVEMNASDGSMNDMTVVESATLDQAGTTAGNDANAAAPAGNASNAM
jgi:hypothetical protein